MPVRLCVCVLLGGVRVLLVSLGMHTLSSTERLCRQRLCRQRLCRQRLCRQRLCRQRQFHTDLGVD